MMNSKKTKKLLPLLSLVIVAFGQPAWSSVLGILASSLGYALFWTYTIEVSQRKQRFWYGTAWFTCVQIIQLSWLTSHPFLYIYPFLLLLSFAIAVQFGWLTMLITHERMKSNVNLLAIASFWVVMEWARLYFLSGFSLNQVGLALTGYVLPLQLASVFGIFGLSFLVILTNLFALKRQAVPWILLTITPFVYGSLHYYYHDAKFKQHDTSLKMVLVQTAFPVEESLTFQSHKEWISYVKDEWKQILSITSQYHKKPIDLLVLPECVVPFGTYSFIYPYDEAKAVFIDKFGPEVEAILPQKELPLATTDEGIWVVNNAFYVQALANVMNAGVVIGLEDAAYVNGDREQYTAAIYVTPRHDANFKAERYPKRILVPMGEYIPFTFCRQLAANYGVIGSFTHGKEAKVWTANGVPFGVSICYEETFGDMMRENRQKGGHLLLNLTSDAWFPNSRLVYQHLEHSRLRTVENGIPLARSCNTGVTCAVDSLGRNIAVLGEGRVDLEEVSDALYVDVSTYHYWTPYSQFGDRMIIGVSVMFGGLALIRRFRRRD